MDKILIFITNNYSSTVNVEFSALGPGAIDIFNRLSIPYTFVWNKVNLAELREK